MRKLNYFTIVFYLFALTLAGCVPKPEAIPKLSLQARSNILQAMRNWQADGKVALRSKDQGHNMSMEWQQHDQNYNLYFFGPFAAGAVQIVGQPGKVSLTTSEGDNYSATSAEQLVWEQIGWELPFTGLPYWLKGMIAPHSIPTMQKVDQYNQLQTLVQDGWTIEYLAYKVYFGITLPEKITMSNQEFKLKFIIHQWKKII